MMDNSIRDRIYSLLGRLVVLFLFSVSASASVPDCPALIPLIDPKVSVTVEQEAATGDFLYSYTISNGTLATDYINFGQIYVSADELTVESFNINELVPGPSPRNTRVGADLSYVLLRGVKRYTGDEFVTLSKVLPSDGDLPPGLSQTPFTLRSKLPPGRVAYRMAVRRSVKTLDEVPKIYTGGNANSTLGSGDPTAEYERKAEQFDENCGGKNQFPNEIDIFSTTIGPVKWSPLVAIEIQPIVRGEHIVLDMTPLLAVRSNMTARFIGFEPMAGGTANLQFSGENLTLSKAELLSKISCRTDSLLVQFLNENDDFVYATSLIDHKIIPELEGFCIPLTQK